MTSNPDVPPFTGYVETTINALRLIHAARQGVIPRITRRLNDSERRTMIKSGAVFVFSVEESGIKRWTDGLLWSPSRIVGNFLVYREINERTSSRGSHKKPYPADNSARALGHRSSPDQTSTVLKGPGHLTQTHNDQGSFKVNGLIKKTITVTIEGSDLHLVSYYTLEDIRSGRLKKPTSRADIMALPMPPHLFRSTNFRVPPKIEIGPDGKQRLVCEAEDLEPVECKTEENTYNIADSPHWGSESTQQSPVESSFTGSPLYHPPGQNSLASGHGEMYGRGTALEKWPVALDNLRISSMSRAEPSWSPSPAPLIQPPGAQRRREGCSTPNTPSWSSLHSQSTRWQENSLQSSSTTNLYLERTRMRSNTANTTPFGVSDFGASRRDSMDELASYQFSGETGNARDASSHRLPWLARETSTKPIRHTHAASPYPPSPTLQYPSHNYQRIGQNYGTSWTSNNEGNMISSQPMSPHHNHGLHYNYASASGSMSSPEEYPKTEEYGEP